MILYFSMNYIKYIQVETLVSVYNILLRQCCLKLFNQVIILVCMHYLKKNRNRELKC